MVLNCADIHLVDIYLSMCYPYIKKLPRCAYCFIDLAG